MTSSQIAAIEAREQRIAHLERRLAERENLVALLADKCAKAAVEAARLRRESTYLRDVIGRAARLAESERSTMAIRVLREVSH